MSLAAALANASRTHKTRLDGIWAELDAGDRLALLDMLTDPTMSHRAAADILTGEGYPVSKTTIGDARRTGWAASKENS